MESLLSHMLCPQHLFHLGVQLHSLLYSFYNKPVNVSKLLSSVNHSRKLIEPQGWGSHWNIQSVVSRLEAPVDNLDLQLASEVREEGSLVGMSP